MLLLLLLLFSAARGEGSEERPDRIYEPSEANRADRVPPECEQSPKMMIAVVGATGGVGQRVVSEALRQGHEVLALARSRSNLTQMEADIWRPKYTGNGKAYYKLVIGNVDMHETTPARLAAALGANHVDLVLSCMGSTKGEEKVVAKATKLLLEACAHAEPMVKRMASVFPPERTLNSVAAHMLPTCCPRARAASNRMSYLDDASNAQSSDPLTSQPPQLGSATLRALATVISSVGIGDSWWQLLRFGASGLAFSLILRTVLKETRADLTAAEDQCLRHAPAGVSCTVVRPAGLSNANATGDYDVSGQAGAVTEISRCATKERLAQRRRVSSLGMGSSTNMCKTTHLISHIGRPA